MNDVPQGTSFAGVRTYASKLRSCTINHRASGPLESQTVSVFEVVIFEPKKVVSNLAYKIAPISSIMFPFLAHVGPVCPFSCPETPVGPTNSYWYRVNRPMKIRIFNLAGND